MPKRYLRFIDLKTAFDSVNLDLLLVKLQNKGVPVQVINTLIRSNSSRISTDTVREILIYAGVAQGKLFSPNLFIIFIDDSVDELKNTCYSILAYLDDTVLICERKVILLDSIKLLEDRSE